MSRDYKVYLRDILDSIRKIQRYVGKATQSDFVKDELTVDAVLRNLEIIGEAAKHIPEPIRLTQPDTEWKKIAGLRDILSHEYFSVNADIIWDIIENKLHPLKAQVSQLLSKKEGKRKRSR